MKFRLLFPVLFLCCTFRILLADTSCNAFTDRVLVDIKANKEYFHEPYEIPDTEKSFGMYEVEFGHIFGLSSLHRIHDVTARKLGKDPYLKVHLAAGEIRIKSKVKKKVLNFGKSADVDVTIPLIEMTCDVVPKQDGSQPEIKDFKIDNVKGVNVKVSGKGLIRDFLLNAFIRLAGRFFQNLVKNTVESKLKSFLKNKVLDYTIPQECLNDTWE